MTKLVLALATVLVVTVTSTAAYAQYCVPQYDSSGAQTVPYCHR